MVRAAGIGAAAGGAVGGGVQASRPQPVKVETETVLNFTLESPLTVTPVSPVPENRKAQARFFELTRTMPQDLRTLFVCCILSNNFFLKCPPVRVRSHFRL